MKLPGVARTFLLGNENSEVLQIKATAGLENGN